MWGQNFPSGSRHALKRSDRQTGSLEGVVHYRPGLDFIEIARTKINHDKLQSDVGALFAKSHKGVIEQLFFPLLPDLDHDKNILDVAQTTLGLLREEIEPTFMG